MTRYDGWEGALDKFKREGIDMTTDTFATAPALAGTPLTQQEMDRALLYMDQTRKGILGAIKDVSEPQWTFKPAPERWSIAEIVEHVSFVLERVTGPAREQLLATPAAPALPDYKRIDDIILNRFPNRLAKFPSPFQPSQGLTHAAALDRLSRSFVALEDYLKSTPDLRAHSLPAMPLKMVTNGAQEFMDGYQWILAVTAHTERHTKQILELKGEADFPAR